MVSADYGFKNFMEHLPFIFSLSQFLAGAFFVDQWSSGGLSYFVRTFNKTAEITSTTTILNFKIG
jgi:hypothetical protein